MSSLQLCDLLDGISQWASESCTWVGQYAGQRITLSPIHPLVEVSALTLRLGSLEVKTPLNTDEFTVQRGECSCCFELRTKQEIWIRFLSCTNHNLTSKSTIQHLFTHCSVSKAQLQRTQELIFYKNTSPINSKSLSQFTHIVRWNWFHITSLNSLSIPPHLEQCTISNCNDLTSINRLDTSESLKKLSVSWCSKLTKISDISSQHLEVLQIHWCPKLKFCPPLSHPKLHKISIQACQSLIELPNVQDCQELEEIRFCWFRQSIQIPDLTLLNKLRFLILRSVNSLTELPEVHTDRLELIDVAESNQLQSISVVAHRLRTLVADGCIELEIVDVRYCPNLIRLSLARVPTLQEIRGLVENHSLQEIQISDAPKLAHLDGLETNFEMRSLTLVNCPELVKLPNWRRLIQMTRLKIYSCQKLEALPDIPLPSLEALRLGGCDAMEFVVPFDLFPNLKILRWSPFTGKEKTIDISSLRQIEQISIKGHPTLQKITGLRKLQQVRVIDFSRCVELKDFPGLGSSTYLRQVLLQGCRSITSIPPLFQAEYLQELSVSHCTELRRLDCLYNHPHLKFLDISHCRNLTRLPLLHRTTRKNLRQIYCSNLPQPIDISKVVGGVQSPLLREINLENSNILCVKPLLGCKQLRDITGLHPSSQWTLLLQIAVEREDVDWVAEHWDTCLSHMDAPQVEDMATACIDAMDIYSTPALQLQLFTKFRGIEHSSKGDSLIPAPVWQQFFEWLHKDRNGLFELFEAVLSKKTIKIDLMREENWFPVLIDVCLKRRPSQRHIELLERIYQHALFRRTPMYDHLRSKWL